VAARAKGQEYTGRSLAMAAERAYLDAPTLHTGSHMDGRRPLVATPACRRTLDPHPFHFRSFGAACRRFASNAQHERHHELV
jgi:hypothetical protein